MRPPRAASLALGAVAVTLALALAYLLIPRTVVVLHPRTQLLASTALITVDPQAGAVDPTGARLPGRIAVAVIDVNEQLTTEGRRPDPGARALGTVSFLNRLGGVVDVPEGTVVMTPSGARFATAGPTSVPAATDAVARVPVQALESGESGNVARLEISRVLGPLAGRLAVVNEESTVGGGQSTAPMISGDDRARVRALALERARADGLRALAAELPEGQLLVGQSAQLEVLHEQTEGQTGEAATAVNFRAQTRISATTYASADLEAALRAAWRPDPPPGYFIASDQTRVGAPEVISTSGHQVALRVPVEVVAIAELDANRIRDQVRGRTADQARRELAHTLPLIAEPRVRVEPSWIGQALRVELALDLNPPR